MGLAAQEVHAHVTIEVVVLDGGHIMGHAVDGAGDGDAVKGHPHRTGRPGELAAVDLLHDGGILSGQGFHIAVVAAGQLANLIGLAGLDIIHGDDLAALDLLLHLGPLDQLHAAGSGLGGGGAGGSVSNAYGGNGTDNLGGGGGGGRHGGGTGGSGIVIIRNKR